MTEILSPFHLNFSFNGSRNLRVKSKTRFWALPHLSLPSACIASIPFSPWNADSVRDASWKVVGMMMVTVVMLTGGGGGGGGDNG